MAGPVRRGHAMASAILGGIEIVCGILIIILSVVVYNIADLDVRLAPYWAGIVFTVPGILGVVVGITKNHCAMIAFMVLNIIAFVLQVLGAISAAVAGDVSNWIVVFIVIAAAISFAASILGCVAVCCTRNEQPGTVMIQPVPQQY